jgi:hypothetical protein
MQPVIFVTAAQPAQTAQAAQTASRVDRLSLVLEVSSGEIVKVEAMDSTGQRRELSQSEIGELAKANRRDGVEQLIERSFEAGLASVLPGGEDGVDDDSETEDEAGLRRILLKPLMENSVALRLLRPEALQRAIVQSLIGGVVGSGKSDSELPNVGRNAAN